MNDPLIDAALAQELIAAQFPHWADLPIKPVATQGWDNRTFRLGDDLSIRLPSAARYAKQAQKEQTWLPHLAPHLPIAIPQVVGSGQPDKAYPFHWSILRWIKGAVPTRDMLQDKAVRIAQFLNALRVISPNGPAPGPHNFHRGGDLRIYDQEVRHCLGQLPHLDHDHILRIWNRACHSAWSDPPVWLHGDMAATNMLVDADEMTAIIDFGNCGIGDPACDLTIAWTVFDNPARAIFRDAINLDAGTWDRAAGWALWKALLQICQLEPGGQETLNRISAAN